MGLSMFVVFAAPMVNRGSRAVSTLLTTAVRSAGG